VIKQNSSLHHFLPEETRVFFMIIFLGVFLVGCSRSPWVKDDGNEVSPKDHVACAQVVQRESQGEFLENEILTERIEKCMVDRGFHRRPWWQLNDLHWHVKEPYL